MVGLCLAGFVSAIRLTSLLDMGMLRNTYVTSLARFTMLHAPAAMQHKSAKAFRSMLFIAEDNGNHLHVGPPPPPPPPPFHQIYIPVHQPYILSTTFCAVSGRQALLLSCV